MARAGQVVTVESDGEALGALRFSNVERPGTRPAYQPRRLTVTVDVAAAKAGQPAVDLARLELPPGWLSDRATVRALASGTEVVSWVVYPKEPPTGLYVEITVSLLAGEATLGQARVELPVTLDLRSQFVPALHGLPWSNSTASLGDLGPVWEIFRQTFTLTLLPRAFFHGLYARMERIDASGGGICSGMVHLALERSLEGDTGPPQLADVLLWHGRQLGDRAALAAATWFLFPSPRRAFYRFRRDLLERGCSTLAFDIAQPKPWRHDLVRAFQSGHTVLPYGLRQSRGDRAEVLVYDPNDPQAAQEDRSIVTFDLARDRYGYPGHADLRDGRTTVFATPQQSYRGQSAILASLASLVLYPRSLRQAAPSQRLLLALGLILGIVAGARAISGCDNARSRRRQPGRA